MALCARFILFALSTSFDMLFFLFEREVIAMRKCIGTGRIISRRDVIAHSRCDCPLLRDPNVPTRASWRKLRLFLLSFLPIFSVICVLRIPLL